jgi:cysteinyl-tRNA synthetase
VEHIPEQIEMIATLIKKGHAYAAEDGSVYFKVDSFPDYGKLSRLNEREITTTQAVRSDVDEYDRESAADFVLWKTRKPEDGLNFWESPWGQGRPGWHLECSAMCKKHLGDHFDVHSGGEDLLFPHHENEIAQSECCNGTAFVDHWFHVHHLMVDGAKMSKSLGNLYTIDDLVAKGHTPEEVRYVLFSGSYGQQLNFTLDSLKAAGKSLERLRDFKEKIEAQPDSPASSLEDFGPFKSVIEALLNDLNTSDALGKLFGLIKHYQKELPDLSARERDEVRLGFGYCMYALGLRLDAPAAAKTIVPDHVARLAAERWEAKQNKEWAKSDELRKAVTAAGWQIKDTKDSYTVEPL